MAGPTQPQVVNEQWSDERVASFLEISPSGDEPEDFRLLLRAYKGMRSDDFERFLKIFVASGHSLNEQDSKGRTLKELVSNHRHGDPYLRSLQKYEAI